MADPITGAKFYAPAELESTLNESGITIAGQSFTGTYTGVLTMLPASVGSKEKLVIVDTDIVPRTPVVDATENVIKAAPFSNSGNLAIKSSTISGARLDFSGNTKTPFSVNSNGQGTYYQISGGIVYNSEVLLLDSVVISDNFMTDTDNAQSPPNTRGLFYNADRMTVKDSIFMGNSCSTGGGGIIFNAGGQLNVSGSTFMNNISSGALIYANKPGNSFTNSLFYKNLGGKVSADGVATASSSGGAFNAQSGAVIVCDGCTFTENGAADGAAGYFAKNAESFVVTNSYFNDNFAVASGGAIYMRGKGAELTNSYFSGNSSGNGGAIRIYHAEHNRTVNLTGCTFVGNLGTGGAIYTSGHGTYTTTVNFKDCQFLKDTDTIYAADGTNRVVFNFSGDNVVNAKIYGHGIVNVADATKFTFDNDTEITISGMTFTENGTAKMTFSGSEEVTFAQNQSLENVSVVIDGNDYLRAGTYTVAKNAGNLKNISVAASKSPWLSYAHGYEGTTLTVTVTDTSTAAAIIDSTTDADYTTIKVNGVYYSGDVYSSAADAIATKKPVVINGVVSERITTSSATLIYNDVLATGFSHTYIGTGKSYGLVAYGNTNADITFYGGTFTNNTLTEGRAGVLYNYSGASMQVLRSEGETGKGAIFDGNRADGLGAAIFSQSDGTELTVLGATFSNHISSGAAVYSNGTASISDSLFIKNLGVASDMKTFKDGSCIGVYSNTADITGCTFTGNTANAGGVFYGNSGVTTFTKNQYFNNTSKSHGGALHLRSNATITGDSFTGNTAGSYGGAIYLYHGTGFCTVDVSGATFTGNTANTYGGAIYVAGDQTMTISNSQFDGNTAGNRGGALYNNGTMTVTNSEFLTATDTIYNNTGATLTFAGTIVNNAAIEGLGQYIISKDTVFTNAVDFSKLNISVDSAIWNGETVIVANGISAIGSFTLDNKELILSVNAENQLVLSKMAAQDLGNSAATVSGTENNLVASGSADTFIANRTNNASQLLTTVKGGEINKNFIGGAFAKAVDGVAAAAIGRVEVNFTENAKVSGQSYIGGYVYGLGGDTAAANAQMTIDNVALNLSGGEVKGNIFAGIHARQAGNASVSKVNISVTGGSHGRIYAGGWAEGNSYSYVDNSIVTVTGGYVDFIYGGGANGVGKTKVGATTITISGDAKVGTIFMSGRYGYSSTGDVKLNWESGNDFKRLSGVSSAGVDNAKSTTVNLLADMIVDSIDYVDKFVFDEGVKLDCRGEFLLGNRSDEGLTEGVTTFDFSTDGLDAVWDAITGIDDFEHAMFSINGGTAVTWNGINSLEITSEVGEDNLTFKLSYDKDNKVVTIAQVK